MNDFVRLYLMVSFTSLLLIGCSNPKYKKYHIVNNDTIAEIYVPSGSKNGILILWPKVDSQNKEEVESICKIMVSDKNAIRQTNDEICQTKRPNLLVYKKNYSYKRESSYIKDDSFLYLFSGAPTIFFDFFGYVEKKSDAKYGNLTKFRSGLEFKVNGKLVRVVTSSQLYINFYTPEQLSEFETVLIKQLINRYGVPFTMTEFGENLSLKTLQVSPGSRNLYFFDKSGTDYRAFSEGNYIQVTGNIVFNCSNNESKSINDIMNKNMECDGFEDLFDFMNEEKVYLENYLVK